MHLFVIRHAQPNDESETGGDGDPPLSELGLAQARAIGRFLEEEHVDHVVSSPMARALQTAEPTARRLGVEIELDDDLKEAGWQLGAYRRTEENLDHFIEALRENPDFLFEPEGRAAFTERVVGSFTRIARENPGRNVAVFCHGMVTACLIGWILDKPPTEDLFQPHYSALSRIQASPNRGLWSVRSFNETMHLYFEMKRGA